MEERGATIKPRMRLRMSERNVWQRVMNVDDFNFAFNEGPSLLPSARDQLRVRLAETDIRLLKNGFLQTSELSTDSLQNILWYDVDYNFGEPDMDLLEPVMEELAKRHREENPASVAASDIRAAAWWQLVCGEISSAEYRETVLFTALSEEERSALEERVARDIQRARQCRYEDITERTDT